MVEIGHMSRHRLIFGRIFAKMSLSYGDCQFQKILLPFTQFASALLKS